MEKLTKLYMEGFSIEAIADRLRFSNKEEVIESLKEMKKKEKNGRDYIYSFKELIVERVISGVKKGQVVKELGVAYRTIDKFLGEFNVEEIDSEQSDEDNMYELISWNSFDVCPECNGKNINDLNIHKEDGAENSYCLNCGTEWLEHDNKVYKVAWEYVR